MLGVINIPLLTLAPDPVNLGLVAMTLGSDLRGKHNVVHSFSDSTFFILGYWVLSLLRASPPGKCDSCYAFLSPLCMEAEIVKVYITCLLSSWNS